MENEMYKKLQLRSADWKKIAFDLGFTNNDVKEISQENPHDVKACLRDMCAKWVQKYPDRSLKDVDETLNSLQTSNSVPQTRKKGCHWLYILSVIILVFVGIILFLLVLDIYTSSLLYPVDSAPLDREFHFQPIVPGVESYNNTTSKYKIPVNKTITDSLKTFEEDFLYLLSNIQVSLYRYVATDEKKLELLEIVLSNWFNVSYYQPDSDQKKRLIEIHNFFLGIFNFMDVSFLGMLDKRFLNRTFSSSLASYKESLDHFMTSTPIINLTNLVWTVHTEQNNVDIVLKLGPYWNNKNLMNLQKLIEYVFGADASLMHLISIHHSVLTVTYTCNVPNSYLDQSVEWTFIYNLLLLKWSVVLKVSIGEVVLFHVNYTMYNDTSETLLDILCTANDHDEQFNNNSIGFLVAIGADVNYNRSSITPLMAAVVAGNKAAVTTLLNLNADPNIVDPASGATTLMMAIWKNDIEIVEILLKFKANPNVVFSEDNSRLLTTKMTYKSPLIVQMLLEYGADPNYKSIFGSPLHIAVNSGCNQCVEILLKFITNPNVRDITGRTPLHYALFNNHTASVRTLLQHNINHNVTLDYAVTKYLFISALECHYEMFKVILSVTGINVNITSEGYTLLMHASRMNCLPIIRLLFQYNADPMVYDEQGYTSLHICIISGYSECVKIHLEFGVDPNIRTKDELRYDYTPLIIAVGYGNLEIMNLLLNKNAKVNTRSYVRHTLSSFYFKLEMLQKWPFSVVNMMYCSGMNSLTRSVMINRIDSVSLLLERSADLDSCIERLSVLGIAIYFQRFKIIEILLKHNASGNGLYDVFPPICLAVQFDHVNIVKTLLDQGADVNIQVKRLGETPLMVAAVNGNVRMVELLLINGADPTITAPSDHITTIDMVNYELINIFGYSSLNIEIAQRYLMIKKLLSFYIQKHQQQTDNESEQETEDDSEQLLSSSETKHTHSNSSIYELVYEAEYVLKNESSAAIGKKIDSLRSVSVMSSDLHVFIL